jgi:YjbE family integral membrane protein
MEGLLLIAKIIMVNIVLSGDNAVVIAMASKNLPEHQRPKAIWWGAFGAVVLRIVLTAAAVALLRIPMIQLFGSLLLLYIAVKLLIDDEGHENVKSASTLGAAVWTIIVADFVMSLDNVLAIAAIAEGDWLLIILGILISIPLIVWGSTFVMRLLHHYPVLVYIGAGILGYTAGEMMLRDPTVEGVLQSAPGYIEWFIPLAATAGVIASGLWKRRSAAKTS